MEQRDMKVRAVIFDVYKTLMQVGPAPADAPERWQALCQKTFGRPVKVSLEEFTGVIRRIVLREHRSAHEVGIAYPEICWPQVVSEALREVRHLSEEDRVAFFREHNRLLRTLTLMPGIADVLHFCHEAELTMGIASNAQNYSLIELDEVLQPEGLSLEVFDPHLRFWSFENGFSKPNPHVFRMLGARIWARGIPLGAIMMIGDRLDNDIRPAHAQGWQTWHLTDTPGEESIGGDLPALLAFLQAQRHASAEPTPSERPPQLSLKPA